MPKSRIYSRAKAQPLHPYEWLWEPLESETSFLLKSMFGCRALYLDGKIVLCFAAKSDPWHGMLIPTDRDRHATLITEFPMLSPHPILSKWLYLSDATDSFETIAQQLASLVHARDPRIGVIPKLKKENKFSSHCSLIAGASTTRSTERSIRSINQRTVAVITPR